MGQHKISEWIVPPQWSLQNRPMVVRAKPANAMAQDLVLLLCQGGLGKWSDVTAPGLLTSQIADYRLMGCNVRGL